VKSSVTEVKSSVTEVKSSVTEVKSSVMQVETKVTQVIQFTHDHSPTFCGIAASAVTKKNWYSDSYSPVMTTK
jgi:hypothetical protein